MIFNFFKKKTKTELSSIEKISIDELPSICFYPKEVLVSQVDLTNKIINLERVRRIIKSNGILTPRISFKANDNSIKQINVTIKGFVDSNLVCKGDLLIPICSVVDIEF